MARRHLIAFAALFVASACGGGDDIDPASAAETPVGRAITADLLETTPADLTETEARCVSGNIVAGIGEEELDALGVTAASVARLGEATLTSDQIETIVEAWAACIDIREQMARSFSVDLSDQAAACLSDGIDLDLAKSLLAASLDGTLDLGNRAVAEAAIVAAGCGVSFD